MNVSDCELLSVLVQEGNITKAAERLFTSQSAISYRIKILENEFHKKLFIRSKTGITPTDEGLLVIDFAKNFLLHYAELQNDLSGESNFTLFGNVKVGTATTIATKVFYNILKSFNSNYPNVNLQLTADNSNVIWKMLKAKELEVGVVRGNVEWDNAKDLLFEEQIYIVSKNEITEKEMEKTTYLKHTYSNANDQIEKWWTEAHDTEPKETTEINNIESCIDMVEQGFGWTILPALCMAKRKGLYLTPAYDLNGEPLKRKTWLMYYKNTKNPNVPLVCSYLKTSIPPMMEKIISKEISRP